MFAVTPTLNLTLNPTGAFKMAQVLLSSLEHSFSFRPSLWLLSLRVILDWLHDAETGTLWRPDHPSQDSLFSYSDKTGGKKKSL